MRLFALPIAVAALLFANGPASACGGDRPYLFGIIHDALPTPLPAGAIVAEVAIESTDGYATRGARARIVRMIQGGGYRGETLIVRTTFWHSCMSPAVNGREGPIVAIPVGYESGVLVVEPIMVQGKDHYRLPDGYRLRGS